MALCTAHPSSRALILVLPLPTTLGTHKAACLLRDPSLEQEERRKELEPLLGIFLLTPSVEELLSGSSEH